MCLGLPKQTDPPGQDGGRISHNLAHCNRAMASWATPYLSFGAWLPLRGWSTGDIQSHEEHQPHTGHCLLQEQGL